MKTKYIILFLLFASFALKAQVENADNSANEVLGPKFFEEFLNFDAKKPNTTRLDIFLQVPYSSVQFIKGENSFTGKYTVTVSVLNGDEDKLIVEKTWNESLEAKEFPQTTSKKNYNLTMRSFYLQPGKYLIRTSVEDRESKKAYTTKMHVTVRDFSSNLSASDIMLIAQRNIVNGVSKIVPNISRNVATTKSGLPFFYEIYSTKPEQVTIDYTISDKKKNMIFHSVESKSLDSGSTQIFHTIRDSSFSLGEYNLSIIIKNSADDIVAKVGKSFFSQWIGVPSTIRDMDKAIDQLVYIASPSDIDKIKDAKTKEEKMKLYLKFWKSQDPTPNTEDNPVFDEYYRRISYANAHFSHYIEGWRSDQGMVFILLGAPNSVDRHPFDIDAKPYEIWQYYDLNRSFIFVDQTGFGDYHLITPLTGDLYRFRYNR